MLGRQTANSRKPRGYRRLLNRPAEAWADGRLLVYSADKGDKLAEIQTGLKSGMGPPITYRLDGRQYIALMGGVGAAAPGGNAGPGNQATPFSPKLVTFVLDGTLNLIGQSAQ